MSEIEEIRLIILGNSEVGKTSFIIKYTENKFSPENLSTLGVDIKLKEIKLKNGKYFLLKIFDTAGEERYKSVSVNFIKKADGIILMYDITDKSSFEAISNWIGTIKDNTSENVSKILVGNKCDLSDNIREVNEEEGQNKANEYKIPFFETSCKDGINVNEVFEKIVEDIESNKNFQNPPRNKIVENTKKDKCC